jgi:hypothetical protein
MTLEPYREIDRMAMQEELSTGAARTGPARRVRARLRRSIWRATGVCAAAASTAQQPPRRIRAGLATRLHELELLEERFTAAASRGERDTPLDPAALARVICGVLRSLALRVRAGDSK